MSNFNLPINAEELLNPCPGQYSVREVISCSEVSKALKVAATAYKDLGPTYILESFDTYFSAIECYQELPRVVVYGAFEDIKKSLLALPNALNLYLEDEELITDEVRQEIQNTLKMSIYLYVNLFNALERSIINDSMSGSAKKKSKATASNLKVNWTSVISVLKLLFQLNLTKFWDSAGVDNALENKLLELTMNMLEDSQIRSDKDTQYEMWSFFGVLVSNYNVTNALVIRLARLVKENEYLVPLLADCVKHLVEVFDAKALLVTFVAELTEWQMQETHVETGAIKHCTRLVVEMAIRLPELMTGLLEYLNKYLRANSHQLRSMVLAVHVEVLEAGSLKVDMLPPTKKEQWRQVRNEILIALEQFTQDSSAFVRSRVFGHISRLVQENAVPTAMLQPYLRRAVLHLKDGTAAVRKAAANCVTIMLKHNTFGHKLPYKKLSKDFSEKRNELIKLKYEVQGIDMQKQEEVEREWNEHLPALKSELEFWEDESDDESSEDDDAENENPNKTNGEAVEQNGVEELPIQNGDITSTSSPPTTFNKNLPIDDLVRQEIHAKNYKSAVMHCRTAAKTSKLLEALRERIDAFTDTQFFLCYMHIVFSNVSMTTVVQPTQAQVDELSKLETSVEYLSEVVKFLESLTEAMVVMCDLLNSVNISDMHEAVDFIITANQFQLDDAPVGVNALLKIMLRNEEDRKTSAGTALKAIFLTTDSVHLASHTTQVVDNLISLYRSVSAASADALSELVSRWATEGTISNDIIDTLWAYFLQKNPTTTENSRTSLCLLRLITLGRHTIIERNYHIVASVCFEERGRSDPLLVVEGLDMLKMLGNLGVSVTSKEPAFRIAGTDPMWKQMLTTIRHYLYNKTPVVNNMLASAVRFIFAVHTHPFVITESLLKMFTPKGETEVPKYQLIRYNVLIGEVVMCMLNYLDTDVYNELKRRQNAKQGKKARKDGNKTIGTEVPIQTPQSGRALRRNISLNSTRQSTAEGNLDESVMDGAEAMDEDADFITHVLEHGLDFQTSLGMIYQRLLEMCRRPSVYPDEQLQVAALTCLARGMLLSTLFCERHAKLMFTILLWTKHVQVKVTLLVHLVDFLDRCPNIVDPYTPKLYKLLEDTNLEVRQASLNTLSLLILKDMIRPQGDIWQLAVCLVDDDPDICRTARCFFLQSTDKSNNLYSYMPDIFTSLSKKYPRETAEKESTSPAPSEVQLDQPPRPQREESNEEKFQIILKYLFTLIDKPKQIEVLVERFCLKYEHADDELAKRITFALSLMTFNEKALQKLVENFPKFKHFVLLDEVYSWMKVIYAGAKTKELKAIVTQLDDLVKEMFKVDGRPPRNIFRKPAVPKKKPVTGKKTARKSRTETPKAKRQKSTASNSGSDSDSDEEGGGKQTRKGRRRRLQSTENF